MFDKLPDQSESETTSEEASRGTDPTKFLQLMTERGQRCSNPTGGQFERPQSCPNGNLNPGDMNTKKHHLLGDGPQAHAQEGLIIPDQMDQKGPATV